MKKAKKQIEEDFIVADYDKDTPCTVCGLPTLKTLKPKQSRPVCPWCVFGVHRNWEVWTPKEKKNLELIRAKAKRLMASAEIRKAGVAGKEEP